MDGDNQRVGQNLNALRSNTRQMPADRDGDPFQVGRTAAIRCAGHERQHYATCRPIAHAAWCGALA